ncbi:MAG: nuclear transport factor 2 family protein [Solirubrobacterales bacterium]
MITRQRDTGGDGPRHARRRPGRYRRLERRRPAGRAGGFDPDFEFVTSGIYPGLEPVYRGHDGFRRFWSDFRGPWQDIAIEVDRIAEGQPPFLAVVGSFHATGRDGIPVERPVGLVFTTGAGLITRIQGFGSADEAFAAAGLPSGGGAYR